MFISIGTNCLIRIRLDIRYGKQETLFFDWLITDFESVIKIFKMYNKFDELFFPDSIVQCQIDKPNRYKISTLTQCVSIHDFKQIPTRADILDFIEKYRRRINRIIEFIKGDKKIYFTRWCLNERDMDYARNLCEAIQEISNTCNFIIVLIFPNQTAYTVNLVNTNLLRITLPLPDNYQADDITKSSYNWEQIFEDIQKF